MLGSDRSESQPLDQVAGSRSDDQAILPLDEAPVTIRASLSARR
jgi:hypothetical protein